MWRRVFAKDRPGARQLTSAPREVRLTVIKLTHPIWNHLPCWRIPLLSLESASSYSRNWIVLGSFVLWMPRPHLDLLRYLGDDPDVPISENGYISRWALWRGAVLLVWLRADWRCVLQQPSRVRGSPHENNRQSQISLPLAYHGHHGSFFCPQKTGHFVVFRRWTLSSCRLLLAVPST